MSSWDEAICYLFRAAKRQENRAKLARDKPKGLHNVTQVKTRVKAGQSLSVNIPREIHPPQVDSFTSNSSSLVAGPLSVPQAGGSRGQPRTAPRPTSTNAALRQIHTNQRKQDARSSGSGGGGVSPTMPAGRGPSRRLIIMKALPLSAADATSLTVPNHSANTRENPSTMRIYGTLGRILTDALLEQTVRGLSADTLTHTSRRLQSNSTGTQHHILPPAVASTGRRHSNSYGAHDVIDLQSDDEDQTNSVAKRRRLVEPPNTPPQSSHVNTGTAGSSSTAATATVTTSGTVLQVSTPLPPPPPLSSEREYLLWQNKRDRDIAEIKNTLRDKELCALLSQQQIDVLTGRLVQLISQ